MYVCIFCSVGERCNAINRWHNVRKPSLSRTGDRSSTLQDTATHCNALQHTATHCNNLLHAATFCNTLQHTATHGNARQQTDTLCHSLQHTAGDHGNHGSCSEWANANHSRHQTSDLAICRAHMMVCAAVCHSVLRCVAVYLAICRAHMTTTRASGDWCT